eukprot:TRINITY_DN6588_c0_g1_i1.p1 TRINITY_DN6588_c0_g1~~TRINITY_DN6588_c0_g1_i1.p1  ORF type:complete len:445 (+),score=51.51 TRINITY_DN6588_c0_g1_i1:362-1696(+)
MATSRVLLVSVLFCLAWVVRGQSGLCGAMPDYRVLQNGSTAFSISHSNGSCMCSGSLTTPASGVFGQRVSSTELHVADTAVVAGASTFGGTALFRGGALFEAGIGIAGSAVINGTLAVNGAVQINGASGLVVNAGGVAVTSGTLSVAGLSVLGAVTSSGGVTVESPAGVAINGGGLRVEGISVFGQINQTANTTAFLNAGVNLLRDAGESANPDLRIAADKHWLHFHTHLQVGNWNPLTRPGDHGVYFSDGAQNTGSLVVGPWTTAIAGFRMNSNGSVSIGKQADPAPGTRLDVNGNVNVDGRLTTSNMRTIFTSDPRPRGTVGQCIPASQGDTAQLFNQTFVLTTPAYVSVTASMIRWFVGRADLRLFADGVEVVTSLTRTEVLAWAQATLSWAGLLAAGNHTLDLRPGYCENVTNVQVPCGQIWGCAADPSTYNYISTLILG